MDANEIEQRARKLARINGHQDADHEIVCTGGRREPVWRFYRDEAFDQLSRDEASRR